MKGQEFFKILDDISEDILDETDKYRKSGASDAAGNSADINECDSEDEIRGEVVHEKSDRFKITASALVALTAAAAGFAMFISHYNGGTESITSPENTSSETEEAVTSSDYFTEEVSDSQSQDKERTEGFTEYTARVIDSAFRTLPAGSSDGSCIFIKDNEKYRSLIRSLSGSFDDHKIYNENGQEFEAISNLVQYDNNILVSGSTDVNQLSAEICVYGNTFDEVLYSVYPDNNETLSFSVFSDNTVYYISQKEKFCLNAFNVKTSEKKQIVFDSKNADYDYVSHPGILKSGNICVLGKKYTSDTCNTDLIIFDRELNPVKTENINIGGIQFMASHAVGYADDYITVYSEESNDSEGMKIKSRILYCDEEDNFTSGEEREFYCKNSEYEPHIFHMSTAGNGKYGLIYGTNSSLFGFDPLTGESDDISEYLAKISNIFNRSSFYFYLDGELCAADNQIVNESYICTDPYGNDTICSVEFDCNNQGSYSKYCDNGKMYLIIPGNEYMSGYTGDESSQRKYYVYEINLSSGKYTRSEFVSEKVFSYQFFYADENYYILPEYVSGKTNPECPNDSICILNHDGQQLWNITPPENDFSFLDIFRTSDNELIVTGQGKNGKSSWTLNPEDGSLQLRDEENPYIYSAAHIPGDDYYAFYYLDDESIYGIKETEDGTVNEKVAELSGLNEQGVENYIGNPHFAWSENEQVWYVFSDGRLFSCVKK